MLITFSNMFCSLFALGIGLSDVMCTKLLSMNRPAVIGVSLLCDEVTYFLDKPNFILHNCHVPCHFFIFPFILIHSHSFPIFISIFRYLLPFSVHSLILDSYAHISGLLSVLRLLCISRVLVLDRSGLTHVLLYHCSGGSP